LKASLLYFLILFGFVINPFYSQEKTITLFNIEKATIDGEDYSEKFKEGKVYTVFYRNLKDSILAMANVWPVNGSQSYGNVYPHQMIVTDETYEGLKSTRTFYKWFYTNTYDDAKGSASIELIQVVKSEGIYYVMKMITSEFQICIYKGYLNEGASNSLTK
jgi:hypothetical protein